MIPAEIISKKREGLTLDEIEIKNFIHGYLSGDITKAQMSALLMAIYFNSMNKDETLCLTEIMVNSGSTLDFHNSKSYVADKHSTGGIGDKISLILAPLMAASGIKIPMIAGRALGFTGGTIDKLEAIPGFNTSPSLTEFKDWVDLIGAAIISQSKEICPADNKLYSPSSIVRERRKLQECNLHLRGQKYKIRQVKLQEEMKARMKKNKLYKVVKYDENLNPKTQNFLNL